MTGIGEHLYRSEATQAAVPGGTPDIIFALESRPESSANEFPGVGKLPGENRPSRFANLAMMAGSIAAGLLVCEMLLHVFPEFQVPVSDEQYLFCGAGHSRHQAHPLYGYTEVPGNTYFERFSNVDPWNFVRVNAEGFRDSSPRTGQPVFVLGDSMTRGSLVEENETFTSLLDSWHPEYSFRNYGIGGYGQPNSIRIYEDKGGGVTHKLVVQAVSLGTDLEDNAERAVLAPDDSVDITVEPANAPGNQPGLLLRTHFFLWKNSKLYQALYSTALRPLFGNKDSRRNITNAMEVTKRLLIRLAADAKSNGADLLVVILPSWAEMDGRNEVFHPQKQRDMIKKVAAETTGVYVVDPTPRLRAEGASRTYGIVDKHLNPLGHFLVAEAIDKWLVNDWPGRPQGISASSRQYVPQQPVTANCANLPDPGQ